ncbi:MAG: SDR family oxidoreductase [Bdellovibrionales bacterium]|nr:SDR family oxidoreductase [Bdellovibrionales bacterium]
MNKSGNSMLITGGGSGIGLALAKEFKELGNQVIVAGRNKEKMQVARAMGLETLEVDMLSSESIEKLAKQVVDKYPTLNVVIHNAGIMKMEEVGTNSNLSIINDTITTNLTGPMRLTEALLPHLLKQKNGAIMTVTSGLAFVPAALFPTYCATKAGLHSYTESLRYLLRDSSVQVLELAPPYVQTELTGQHQATDPNAMPLSDFIKEVMTIIGEKPDETEILVERVQALRNSYAGGKEKYLEFFKQFNDSMASFRK